jgi:hypothetical protein
MNHRINFFFHAFVQLGATPSKVNGRMLQRGETALMRDRDLIHFVDEDPSTLFILSATPK